MPKPLLSIAALTTILFVIVAIAGGTEPAVDALVPTALHLRSGMAKLESATSLHGRATGPIPEAAHFVLQLDGALTPERLARVADAGVKLGQYLPANAYVVRLPAGFDPVQKLGDLEFVRWVGPFDKAWKIEPTIGQLPLTTPDRLALQDQGIVKLTAVLFEGEDLQAAANAMAALPGAAILDASAAGDEGTIELTIPREVVPQLADLRAVQWVEEAGEVTLRNDTNKWILQSNASAQTPVWDSGIHGENQIAGHIDGGSTSGMNYDHCAFRDPVVATPGPTHRKVVAYFGSTGDDGHATHTAGTFFGDPVPTGGAATYRGMAYLAKVAFTSLGTVTTANLYSKFQQNHNAGARVHSNSWGTDGTTLYTTWCRDTDKFSFDFEDDLVCFAVTNAGGVVYTPENAKNCLAVNRGSDTPSQGTACGSISAGPTADGRRKPEIMAPGCSTVSSSTSGATCTFSGSGWTGTSMACPAVAGAGILVRQYFTDGYYPTGFAAPADGFTPTGALIKATLLNGSVDMTGIAGFPSNSEGWGRVLLDNALYFNGDARGLIVLADIRNANGLTTGQSSMAYNVNVNSNAQALKVTLVWTEKEAAVNANPVYINNLNLEVTAPGAVLYRGNVFSGGQSTTGGSADAVNNVEQVLLNTPAVGSYTVQVKAPTVNTVGPQGFALVVTGAVSSGPPAPTISSIDPNSGDAGTVVAISELLGTNFQLSGTTTVKLRKIGQPDIVATGVLVVNSTKINCTFDLTGVAEIGAWDVEVTNPDLQVATLAGGFTITDPCPMISLAPATLPATFVGRSYEKTITAGNGTGPYTYAVTGGSLPPGLTLSPAGDISGTATQGGTFNFVVTATDANDCTGNRPYSIVVRVKSVDPF